MSEGFNIRQIDERDLGREPQSLRKSAHDSLDSLLDEYYRGEGSFGGVVIVDAHRLDGSRLVLKVLFADVTDQKDCVFCGGSGLEGG